MDTDAYIVGGTSGVTYTIEDSSENTLFFECNIGTHCSDNGMNLKVNVADVTPVDCVGEFGECDSSCEKTYTITTEQKGLGKTCSFERGHIQSCSGGNCSSMPVSDSPEPESEETKPEETKPDETKPEPEPEPSPSSENATDAPTHSKYDPCNGKTDGDTCTFCDPAIKNTTCVETMVFKTCKSGECSHAHAEPCIALDCERGYELVGAKEGCGGTCEKVNCQTKEVWSDEKKEWCCEHEELGCPSPKYDPCNGKKDGDTCTLCDPEDTTCAETDVVKTCKSGNCSHAHAEPCAVDCERGYELVGAKEGCGGTCEKVNCQTKEAWSDEKKEWCCEHEELGCKDSPEPHRAAESDNSSMVTTPESDVSNDKPIDIIEVIFGNSVPRVEACSEDTVRVIWNGTHDLIETKTADCNSEALEVWEDILQPKNYEKDFTVLGGKYAGHTRYFKCSVHCTATSARFEITCPSDGKVGASSAPTNDTGSNLEIPAILVALCVSGCLGAIILGCYTRRSKKGYVAMQADDDNMDFVNDDQKLEETPLKWLP